MDAISHINNIINQWDPIGLMDFCPSNEYHTEIEDIAFQVNKDLSPDDLGAKIYNIFLDSFGEQCFRKNLSDCIDVAKIILKDFPLD